MLSMILLPFGYLTLAQSLKASNLNETRNEYCNGEYFEAQCPTGEIILMTSALFGRMSLGRCLTIDRGDMGCQADVLSTFDKECSGKQSCRLIVTDRTIQANGGCGAELILYLMAGYKCVKELDLQVCPVDSGQPVLIDSRHVFLSSYKLNNICGKSKIQVTLAVEDGQRMNISIVDLEDTDVYSDSIIGSLLDMSDNKHVVYGSNGGRRTKHLMISASNLIELSVQNPNKMFLLSLRVLGCRNLQPPPGAWMTRNGDVMDMGCHSGAKSWSMTCQDNQWVGSVGQCGTNHDAIGDEFVHHQESTKSKQLSINASLFGISSLIIFLSAVIFLSGVCVLKRKINNQHANIKLGSEQYRTIQFPPVKDRVDTDHMDNPFGANTMSGFVEKATQPPFDTYINSGMPTGSESVKYYVLENQ